LYSRWCEKHSRCNVFLRQSIPVVFSVLLIVVFWLSTAEYLWTPNTVFVNCDICLQAEGNHLQDFLNRVRKNLIHTLSAHIEPISRQIGILVKVHLLNYIPHHEEIWASGSIAPCFLNFSTRQKRVGSFIWLLLYSWGKRPT
jgi:hypothetical protein